MGAEEECLAEPGADEHSRSGDSLSQYASRIADATGPLLPISQHHDTSSLMVRIDRRFPFRARTPQIRGLYLVKFAVNVTACYLAIQLLITFAEVLLPFIFAVLCMIVLEPLKRFINRSLQRLLVEVLQRCKLHMCL